MSGTRGKRERGIRPTKNGRWEYNFPDGRGGTGWGTADTKEQARACRGEKLAAVKIRGEKIPTGKTTVAEEAERWLASKRLREGTRKDYRRALDLVILPRFGRWKLAAVDAASIVRLIRDLEHEGLHAVDPTRPKRPLGSSSIDNYLKPLQGTLKYAVRHDSKIATNPFDVLTPDDRPLEEEREAPHEWSDGDVEALLSASETIAKQSASRYDYTPLLRVSARLGLRIGEVLGLTWSDFDHEAARLRIERQWLKTGQYGPPKTKAGKREIPLPDDLVRDLIALRLRSRYSAGHHPIFASLTGTPLAHRNVFRRGFVPARDLAGLPAHLVLHDLRHAAASRLIHAGLDAPTVAKVLGHKHAMITLKVYSHIWNRAEKDERVRRAL
jgi:integrase